MIKAIRVIFIAAVLIAFIYATYWLAKTGSYFFFYEDMVKETITEMVKAESLRK